MTIAMVDKCIKANNSLQGSLQKTVSNFIPQRLESLSEFHEFDMQAGMMQIPQIHSLMEVELIVEWYVLQVDL
jgi:hypothetical protein